jgi:hypothetical protein
MAFERQRKAISPGPALAAPIFAALMSKRTLILLDPEISKRQKSL